MDISKLSLNIQKILGSSVSRISHLTHTNGCLVYTAGNIIVFYSPILDEQITYLTHASDSISSIEVSPDERYLAVCDSGKNGCTAIYEISDLQNVKGVMDVKWILRGHKKGIDHLVFSKNGKYIVTVSNQDGSMFLWQGAQSITRNRNSKAIAKVFFDKKGDLVTVGRGYIKLWPFDEGIVIRKEEYDQDIIEGKALSFGKKFSTQDFVDASILSKENTQKLILLSSEGLICIISPGYEKIEKWVDVMMQGATSIELIDSIALCCGDHALVKAVDLDKLAFKGKFPKPPPTARQNLSEEEPLECMENDEFPKCLGAKRVGEFVVTLYSNRSMFVWRMEQDGDIQAVRSILSHRAKVTCLNILEEVEGGELIFFASASDDHTVRLWHCYGKQPSNPTKSVDVGALLGLKRNVYCKHLTHIIYTHSQHPVNQIKSYCQNSIVCTALNELLVYSLENFSLTLLQNFDDERLVALETWKQLILLGLDQNKIRIYELRHEKLEKVRQFTVESSIERLLVTSERILVNGKGITRCLSLDGKQMSQPNYKTERIGTAGNCWLGCEKKVLNIYSLVKNKKTNSVTLNHQLDDSESITKVKSNSWLIVLITSFNRLLLLNFSASVLYSEELNSVISDVEITEQGKIILSTEEGVIFMRKQSTTGKYRQIDQKVQKWFEQNEMNWMDGSVWASKNKSHSISGPSGELLRAKSHDEVNNKEKMTQIQIQDSIKLGTGSWADLSVSIKKPEFQNNVALQYKNEQNKKSIFNPSSICAQANKIYQEVNALQHKRNDQKPPLSGTNKSGSAMFASKSKVEEQKDSSLSNSRPKRTKIFNQTKEKEKEQYYPKFSNNFVESFIDDPPNKEKASTQANDRVQFSQVSQKQSSIDFGFSRYDTSPFADKPQQNQPNSEQNSSLNAQFVQSLALLLELPEHMQTHETLVSLILEHGEQYELLYKILDKVYGKELKQKQKEETMKKVDEIWSQLRNVIEKS